VPVLEQPKRRLRDKYGIDHGKFVILHVGSVKKRRNVRLMSQIQTEDNQTILVGSLSTGVEQDTLDELKSHNCWVWLQYYEHIEELYALADCYVFPTQNGVGSIEMPLSVLEAMACNLPIISTRFGALPRAFKAGEGMFYADTAEEFREGLDAIRSGVVVRTREKVLPYAWQNIVARLEETYSALLVGRSRG
jgi:glycosyltransferase involved in cell wall biosynthesis